MDFDRREKGKREVKPVIVILSLQPPKRSPIGPGCTEAESDCAERDQREEREREILAWAPQPGKKLG